MWGAARRDQAALVPALSAALSAPVDGPFILLDDARAQPSRATLFERPVGWVRADAPAEVGRAFASLARARREGLTAAGFLSYELGYCLEPKLAPLLPERRDVPLLLFGLFEGPAATLSGADIPRFLEECARGPAGAPALTPLWDEAAYRDAFARVKEFIAAGDVYQINLTFPQDVTGAGDPVALYARLRRLARAAYGALLRLPGLDVLSLSPELFVAGEGGRLRVRPMKGTAPRGPALAEDEAAAEALRADEKQRAENLMIVDLLRNDLSRVCAAGSVRATDLFTVETYPTLHTLTSGVEGALVPGADVEAVLRALFPCGSVTGAPKIRAMEIVRALEPRPRGVYCGAVGRIDPDGTFAFNVAIRTLTLRGDAGVLNVGSGLVYDSDAAAEYAECLLKSRFVTSAAEPFSILETMRWRPHEGFFLLDRHLARAAAAARYFQIPFDRAAIVRTLSDAAAAFGGEGRRVRLLLGQDGGVAVEAQPFVPPCPGTPVAYIVARTRLDADDPFVRHKTTRRAVYDAAAAEAAAAGADEALLLNGAGALADGGRSTLFVERDGVWLTPPLADGALDGCLRRELIETGPREIREERIWPQMLADASAVYVGNAVRGLQRAIPHATA